jgi:uncharacterized membrane protein YfhO
VPISSTNPAQMTLGTRSSQPGELRVRVTNVPGWRATIDGQSVPLIRSSIYGLELRVPAGTHRIELQYSPSLFTVGILIAVLTTLVLAAFLIWGWRRSRRLGTGDGALTPDT